MLRAGTSSKQKYQVMKPSTTKPYLPSHQLTWNLTEGGVPLKGKLIPRTPVSGPINWWEGNAQSFQIQIATSNRRPTPIRGRCSVAGHPRHSVFATWAEHNWRRASPPQPLRCPNPVLPSLHRGNMAMGQNPVPPSEHPNPH